MSQHKLENYKKNVAIHKLMLRQNKELKAEISVATKEDYVATIKLLSKISIATKKFYVATENGKEVR